MASCLFEGKNIMKTLKNIIKSCEVCQKNNPKTEKLAKSGLQQSGKYPGEAWEIDFTHMPKANEYSCLQVWADTFTGWIEAFPCHSEQAKEVIKVLIHEIIPRFGLPRSLQSDNGSAFKAAVTQGVSKALGIEDHLHCSWRPQSSGKVEKANDIIKRHLCKLTQETQAAAAAAKSLQSCLTLCEPIDGSPPGSPVPGILQARTLEWVSISFSDA